ncbi:E3 SUMO-protein ligase PIAS1 [Bagarius yarrelli]|uniref:E3 SUMO-protein ligase PIAS1 n=1 Tax=Bagarius yarrelli TaxID=175774 RepID=A0A556TLC1_BAGYA|nr:E3 SUMO-protein ligase PIAS1 [Bagarius yarrelli]
MVMSLRVSELQVLLGYAGRNKHGRKHELLTKALHLLKAGCSPAVHMKIKELYRRRFPTKLLSPAELALQGVHAPAVSLPTGLTQLPFDGHVSPASPLLPISLLGPKHELALPHLSSSLHPVHPDVKLQRLPFYDVLDELIKPTSLDSSQRFQETCFAFALTPQQVQQISSSMDISGTKCDFTVQVQLRFCLSETSCPQEDHFPPNLCVKVNGKPCNLPGYLPPTKNGVEPKRPSRPINITSLVRLSTTVPNTIVVSWTSEIGRSYSMAVYLVKQQSSTSLLQRLRAKGIRNPDHSRALTGEDAAYDPVQVADVYPSAVLRRYALHPNEREEAHLGGCQPSAPEQKSSSHTNGSGGKKVEVIDLTLDSSSEDEEEEEPPIKRNCPSLSPVSPQMNKGFLFGLFVISPCATQHYNMVMAAAAAASASEDHDLLLNRFLPYSSSQLYLDAPGTPVSSSGGAVHAALNVNRSNSNSSSSSSLPTIPRSGSDIYSSIPDIISLD